MSIILMFGGVLALGQGAADSPLKLLPPPPALKLEGKSRPPVDEALPSGSSVTLPALENKNSTPSRFFTSDAPKPVEITAPLLTPPVTKPAEPAAPVAETTSPDRWALMRELQGTLYGKILDDHRMYISGWLESSFNVSTAAQNNATVVWTDRANEPLFQQGWIRFGRSLATSGTTDISFGFQVDILAGSDYRFTLPRGLFNSQPASADGNQNLYGVDPIQHYVAAYVPTLFEGTEFRVGRLYTPWGLESLEAVSTPLVTRSYAFNYAPPFTHCGVGMYTTFSPVWSGTAMIVNGNDVYFGDTSEEWRFVGSLKWTQPGGQNTVQVSTSVGRGKFNAGAPFTTSTVALPNEPAGRNNINVFDVIWTHTITPTLAYSAEGIFGYQTNVPGIANAAGGGTAHWASLAQYLTYTISPTLTTTARFELFDDFEGQRTGFEGLYSAITLGVQYKPRPGLIIRPEIRYDHNFESKPFEGKSGIFVAAMDLIIRF